MADPIRPLSIDALAWYPIVTSGICREVAMQESQLAGTATFLVRRPAGSGTPVTRAAGTPFIVRPLPGIDGMDGKFFRAGVTVCEIQAAPGTSMTFDIVEG